MVPFQGPCNWLFKRLKQESEHLAKTTCRMCCIVCFPLVVSHYFWPYPVHVLVIATDKILVAIIQSELHTSIILIHINVSVFDRKIFWANHEFSGATKIPSCRKQMRILSCDPERHESSHRKAGNCTMFAVTNCSVFCIDVFDQFG